MVGTRTGSALSISALRPAPPLSSEVKKSEGVGSENKELWLLQGLQ